jgi:phosphoglycerate-specific signal transduction histidine kinase
MNAAAQSNVLIRLIEANTLLAFATGALLLYTICAVAFHFWKRKRR